MNENLEYYVTEARDFTVILNTFFKINKREINQSLQITNLDITQWIDIKIQNCRFNEEVILNGINIENSITFNNCIFSKRVNLINVNSLHINFQNCLFDFYISFKGINSENIQFTNCVFNNNKITQLHEFECSNFYFRNNIIKSDFHFKPTAVKRVILEGSETNNLITFSYLNRDKIIDEILIFTYQGYKTEYLLRNLSTSKLQIVGEIKDSGIILNRVNVGTAILDNFSNYGNFKITFFEALNEKSNIILKNSNLGKLQASSIDFSKFKRILISNTNFIDIVPVNVKWCYDNLQSDDLSAKKENYRQLKLINRKNEDIDSKLKFERYEMHTFLKLSKENKIHFRDKLILVTNYLSNDFGISWTRALYLLLSFSVICYTIIKYRLGFTQFDMNSVVDEIGYFLNFVNPIHQFDKIFKIEESQKTNGAIFIDSISKIINAYLIFQLVSSFRKYSQK